MLKQAYASGRVAAMRKFALGPPTQVDQFVADVEMGKDVPPESAQPPMAGNLAGPPTALDGSVPLQLPTPPSPGSTVAPEMAGAPAAPPPSMGALGG